MLLNHAFFNLRLLAKVKPFLSATDLEKLIHAFIFSRLDYFNTIYIGVNQTASGSSKCCSQAADRYTQAWAYYTDFVLSQMVASSFPNRIQTFSVCF